MPYIFLIILNISEAMSFTIKLFTGTEFCPPAINFGTNFVGEQSGGRSVSLTAQNGLISPSCY
jgi:hypothetical protein